MTQNTPDDKPISQIRRAARKIGLGRLLLRCRYGKYGLYGRRGLLNPEGFLANLRSRLSYAAIWACSTRGSVPQKPTLPVTLLVYGGATQRRITSEALWSLYNSWSAIPEQIRLVTDNTIPPDQYRQVLDWWPGPISAVSGEEVLSVHASAGRQSLVGFASKNILGLKLAAIADAAERGPVIAVDTDVLWFGDLSVDLAIQPSDGLIVRMMEDFQPAYEPRLLDDSLRPLAEPPFLNSGVVYVCGSLCGNHIFQRLVDKAARTDFSDRRVGGFAEQTILAGVSYATGVRPWALSKIYLSLTRDGPRFPASFVDKPWIGRHYVSPIRWLFWEDAFALRFIRWKNSR